MITVPLYATRTVRRVSCGTPPDVPPASHATFGVRSKVVRGRHSPVLSATHNRSTSVVPSKLLLHLIPVELTLGYEDHMAAKLGDHRSQDGAWRRCISIFRE